MEDPEKIISEQSINTADPLIGRVFDEKFRIEEKLDAGGMGVVYRATDLQEEKRVALKVLTQKLSASKKTEELFWQEAQTASMVEHPNVVHAIDLGITEDDYAYLVMDFLEGQTLREVIAHDAPLDLTRAIVLILQAAEGVGALHNAGIIHRDLKPTNIFITRPLNAPSVVKVLDFSLAKLLPQDEEGNTFGFTSGKMRGTPRYMSPEQCEGQEITMASDVYSLGVILFEMLTKTTPFNGENKKEIAMKQSMEHPPSMREYNPNIPTEIDEFVVRVLSKDAENRPGDADKFRIELKEIAERLGYMPMNKLESLSVEKLLEAGRASPSGSLVIDAETLRLLQTGGFTKKQ